MISTFETIETSSDSSEETDSSDEEEVNDFQQTKFMNMTSFTDYEKNRDLLYTKDIIRKRIVIDSHNYFQPTHFNTSNFTVVFDFDTNEGTSLITTNYDIYHNVIGFRLIRTTIRTPPYNVNSTNNIIRYKKAGSDTIYSVTLNKGVYNMTNISTVFQKYNGSLYAATSSSPTQTVNINTYAQYSIYSDPTIGPSPLVCGTFDGSIFTPGDGTFSLTFIGEVSTTTTTTSTTMIIIRLSRRRRSIIIRRILLLLLRRRRTRRRTHRTHRTHIRRHTKKTKQKIKQTKKKTERNTNKQRTTHDFYLLIT